MDPEIVRNWVEPSFLSPSPPRASPRKRSRPAPSFSPSPSRITKTRRRRPPTPPPPPALPSPVSPFTTASMLPPAPRSASDTPLSNCKSASSTSGSTASEATSKTVRSPRYRQNVLELNGVFISKSHDAAPASVQSLVDAILGAPRDEAAPSAEELQRWVRAIVAAEDLGEEDVGNVLLSSVSLLPSAEHHPLVQRIAKQAFARPDLCLPRISCLADGLTTNVPRISTPVPKVTYGLRAAAFTTQQRVAMTTISPTNAVSEPIPELFWPFLAVEFKAQNKAGSMHTATNQCAGAGSAAVKAQKILAGQWPVEPPVTLAAFSCAMDGRSAELFVHYASEDGAAYHLASVNRYLLADPDHLARLHLHLHNIADWGVGNHLVAISRLLDAQVARALPRG